TSQPR
ncbi:hypothetical protein VCHENC02_1859B, partial [Vibrio harveyi]